MRLTDTFGKWFETQVMVALAALLGLLVLGTVSYRLIEGWTWIDSFYFSVCTLTTVGYGDLSPTSEFSRLFTAVYALSGVAIALTSFGILGRAYLLGREAQLLGLARAERDK
jgi:hypothetical protein